MLDSRVFLSQTDTTVGFLSHSEQKLFDLKKRNKNAPFLQICSSLSSLKKISRVPNKFKNIIRKRKKTTFIYPNKKAIRLSFNPIHNRFLDRHSGNKPFFSTSANLSGCSFDKTFAINNSDIIIHQQQHFADLEPSNLYKINNSNMIKIAR